MKNKSKDIAVIGFALFSMFFGAGNLLFPPYLGLVSGQSWIVSLIGFVLADVGLALLVMAASAKCSGDLDKVLNRVGKKYFEINRDSSSIMYRSATCNSENSSNYI